MEHIPSVYIACLASYNNGILHGSWIPLDSSHNVEESITKVLKSSPIPNAEEWAVHDHEYCGELNEYTPIKPLQEIQAAYREVIEANVDWSLFWQYCDCFGEPMNPSSFQRFQETYAGAAESLEIWCEQFLEDSGSLYQIPDSLRYYFDFKAYARDLEISDVHCLELDGQQHVFWNH